MINFDKLNKNLGILQQSLPKKSATYTPEYPRTIEEALTKYANQRTVNLFGIRVYLYNEQGWPVPLYVDNCNIRVGWINKFYFRLERSKTNRSFRRLQPNRKFKKITFLNARIEPWTWVGIPFQRNTHRKNHIESAVIEMFEANLRLFKKKLFTHPYLRNQKEILKEVFFSYARKHWASCIYVIFPILDSVARKILKTDRLTQDIQAICRLFDHAGIGKSETDAFMAHTSAVMLGHKMQENEISKEQCKELTEKGYRYNLNMIGPALSSFLQFSNRYYGYVKKDDDKADPLNRHAIIHGSNTDFSTKANVVRLFTYLYLILEIEPVLSLLFTDT